LPDSDLRAFPEAPRRSERLKALVALARPRQWIKNVLVAAAPVAAGRWAHPTVIAGILLAALTFTVVAAGCYMVNDVRDAERDRRHPVKRLRPVAAGIVSPRSALLVGAACVAIGPGVSLACGQPDLAVILGAYTAVTMAYSFGIKHVPVLEVAVVASGFVLRCLAGAAATDIPVSNWFLGAVTAGAVMVALGKRSAELALHGDSRSHRPSLRGYTPRTLTVARTGAVACLLACYVGWTLSRPTAQAWPAALSLLALTGAIGRYEILTRSGTSGAPEELILTDRALQASASIWLACMVWGAASSG
jgi:decaprenyl-phosphate phosphoribosyltransferase